MITIQAFSELDPLQVSQNVTSTIEQIQEDNPNLELRRGVIADLLAFYHAILATQLQVNVNDYLNARSLLEIQANPTLADPSLVDDVLSNFLVTRGPGTAATGEVTIVVSSNITLTIAQGSVWQANGQLFQAISVFTAKFEASQVNNPNDRLLTQTSDGNWAFTINVQAQQEGSASLITKDTLIVPLAVPANYVNSFAASDFVNGIDEETNQALLTRLQQGIASPTMSNRVNMQAMLRQNVDFSSVVTSSIIGFGDEEMLRDRHWIFPVSGGGRVDWYIRTQEQVLNLGLTKTATLISKANTYSTWQFSINKDDAPGFYEIVEIKPIGVINTQGGFVIDSDIRSNDLTGPGFIPDIQTISEGAYSRFQTTVIQFEDSITNVSNLSIGATQDYSIGVLCLPLISNIQDFLSNRDIHCVCSDCLVKAPVPCFVQLSFTIYKQSGAVDPDVNSIKTALCHSINNIGFVGQIYAGQLQDVIYGYLASPTSVSSIDIFGKLSYPDGMIKYLRSSEVLTVPSDASRMVSSRTVQFFVTPNDISIAISTAIPTNN